MEGPAVTGGRGLANAQWKKTTRKTKSMTLNEVILHHYETHHDILTEQTWLMSIHFDQLNKC